MSIASGFSSGLGQACEQTGLNSLITSGFWAWRELGVIWGVEDELDNLQRTFLRIRYLEERVESSPLRFSIGIGGKAWQSCYQHLTKLVYDAEALIDRISLQITTYSPVADQSQENPVRAMVLRSFQWDLPREIKKMQGKLEHLANEMMTSLLSIENIEFDYQHKTGETSYSTARYVNSSTSFPTEAVVVGRDKDREIIKAQLLRETDDVDVISLVGMGGIGKTSLARLVYNDQVEFDHFKLRMWISVQVDSDARKLTKTMIEKITMKGCTLSDLDTLQVCLKKLLVDAGKVLLVLDDYSCETDDEWDSLFAPLRFACKGSKIIVTTRNARVSTIVGSTEAHNLTTLSDDDCWQMMRTKAFFKKEENKSLELLGSGIAKKCKGLPLAAKTIGSLLNRQSTIDGWESILKSDLCDLPLGRNGIFPSLMRSYSQLPVHLQKCFRYCSIFPKNYKFEVKELVRFWMAENFIQPIGERKLEDIGAEYCQELHSRSFFLPDDDSTSRLVYKMHELIHDLVRLVSSDTCVHASDHYALFGDACHLYLKGDDVKLVKASRKNERLRTFFLTRRSGLGAVSLDPELLALLKFVRVLGFVNTGLSMLPDHIENLIHLRLLDISGNNLRNLRSICGLLALQTLKLLNNPQLTALPTEITNLLDLRHLEFDVDRITSMPPNFGKLKKLQTLSAFIVGKCKGQGIEELMNMDALSGCLYIKDLHNVYNEKAAEDAKLERKQYLNKLGLLWEDIDQGLPSGVQNAAKAKQVQVLANLQPNVNVEEMIIKKYSGLSCPRWLGDPSHRFTSILLAGLSHCEVLPSLGKLPMLKFLCIKDMPRLRTIDDNFYGDGGVNFPSLESLEVYEMIGLIEWKESSSNISMPSMTSFVLDDAPKLISLPANLKSLPNSHISSCPCL